MSFLFLFLRNDRDTISFLFKRYDRPVVAGGGGTGKNVASLLDYQSHYQNFNFDQVENKNHDVDDHDVDPTYLNIDTYDIPRHSNGGGGGGGGGGGLYDHPRNNNNNNNNNSTAMMMMINNCGASDYDYPKGLIPLSARLLLNASRSGRDRGHLDDGQEDQDQSPRGM